LVSHQGVNLYSRKSERAFSLDGVLKCVATTGLICTPRQYKLHLNHWQIKLRNLNLEGCEHDRVH